MWMLSNGPIKWNENDAWSRDPSISQQTEYRTLATDYMHSLCDCIVGRLHRLHRLQFLHCLHRPTVKIEQSAMATMLEQLPWQLVLIRMYVLSIWNWQIKKNGCRYRATGIQQQQKSQNDIQPSRTPTEATTFPFSYRINCGLISI